MKTKTKKKGHTWWNKRLDKKLGDWMREKYTECSVCNKHGYLQVSHIYPKGTYPHLRYDPVNILPMDGGCHQYKWHANPKESWEWFMKKYPNREIYLQEAKNLFIKRDEEYYKKIDKALDDRNIRSLLVLDNIKASML